MDAVRNEDEVSESASDELLPMVAVREVTPTWCSPDENGRRRL